MQRQVERERSLPCFEIDLATLETLVAKLRALFPANHYLSITIEAPRQTFTTKDLGELRDTAELPARCQRFSIWISVTGSISQYCSIRTTVGFGGDATVRAIAPDEAWCAGVVDVASTFFENHKRWYTHIRGWPLTLTTMAVPAFLAFVGGRGGWTPWFIGALLLSAFLYILWFGKGRIFPAGTLVIRPEGKGWREWVPELALAVGVLALIASVVQIFFALPKDVAATQQMPPTRPPEAPPTKPISPLPKAPDAKPKG